MPSQSLFFPTLPPPPCSTALESLLRFSQDIGSSSEFDHRKPWNSALSDRLVAMYRPDDTGGTIKVIVNNSGKTLVVYRQRGWQKSWDRVWQADAAPVYVADPFTCETVQVGTMGPDFPTYLGTGVALRGTDRLDALAHMLSCLNIQDMPILAYRPSVLTGSERSQRVTASDIQTSRDIADGLAALRSMAPIQRAWPADKSTLVGQIITTTQKNGDRLNGVRLQVLSTCGVSLKVIPLDGGNYSEHTISAPARNLLKVEKPDYKVGDRVLYLTQFDYIYDMILDDNGDGCKWWHAGNWINSRIHTVPGGKILCYSNEGSRKHYPQAHTLDRLAIAA